MGANEQSPPIEYLVKMRSLVLEYVSDHITSYYEGVMLSDEDSRPLDQGEIEHEVERLRQNPYIWNSPVMDIMVTESVRVLPRINSFWLYEIKVNGGKEEVVRLDVPFINNSDDDDDRDDRAKLGRINNDHFIVIEKFTAGYGGKRFNCPVVVTI